MPKGDQDLFVEAEDEYDLGSFGDRGPPPRPYEPAASRASRYSNGGNKQNSVREQPFLEEFLDHEEFSEGTSNDRAAPMSSYKLPGQPISPAAHKELREKPLLKPSFGPLLSIEEFQEELDQDLRQTFGDNKAGHIADPFATRQRAALTEEKPTFVRDVMEDADDYVAKFAPAAAARSDMQNEQLAEAEAKLTKLREKAKELQDQQKKEAEINKTLKAEVKKLKTQNLDMEERVEDLRREGEATGLVKAANAAEEKKFRELEARMKKEDARRRALELGQEVEEQYLELPGDRFGIMRLIQTNVKKMRLLWQRWDGMHTSCKSAERRFGSGIALYFWFYRWMLVQIGRLALVWIIFFIVHWVDFFNRGKKLGWVGTIFPTIFLYSSFTFSVPYASLVSVTCAVTLMSTVFKFIHEFEAKHKNDVFNLDGRPDRYAKIALNAWDWNTQKVGDGKERASQTASLFQVLKLEDEVGQRIAARTEREWTILYIKRAIGISLNVIFLLAGLAAITFSRLFLGEGVAAQYTGATQALIQNLPTIIPSLINGILPQIVEFSVVLEAWDDPQTQLKNRVGRLYFAKIANALIQVVILLIFFRGPIPGLGNQRITLRDCGYATCEDQVGVVFFTLFLTDVIVGTVSNIGVAAASKGIFTMLGMPAWAEAEFNPPVHTIKILYQQIFLWFSMPHFPIVVPIGFIVMYIQFQVDVFVLFHFNAKPLRPFDARDTGVYFTIFYAMTFFLFALWMYYVFFELRSNTLDLECCRLPDLIAQGNSTVKECFAAKTVTQKDATGKSITIDNNADVCQAGALASNGLTQQPAVPFETQSMSQSLATAMRTGKSSAWVLGMMDSPLLAYFVATIFFVFFLYERLRVNVLEQYLDEKINEMNNAIVSMEDKIKIKQKRIELITAQGKDGDENEALN